MIKCPCGSKIDSDKAFDKGASTIICYWCRRIYDCLDIKTREYKYTGKKYEYAHRGGI